MSALCRSLLAVACLSECAVDIFDAKSIAVNQSLTAARARTVPGERGKAAINASSTSLQLHLTLVSELASETKDNESESAAGDAVDVDVIAPSSTSTALRSVGAAS